MKLLWAVFSFSLYIYMKGAISKYFPHICKSFMRLEEAAQKCCGLSTESISCLPSFLPEYSQLVEEAAPSLQN